MPTLSHLITRLNEKHDPHAFTCAKLQSFGVVLTGAQIERYQKHLQEAAAFAAAITTFVEGLLQDQQKLMRDLEKKESATEQKADMSGLDSLDTTLDQALGRDSKYDSLLEEIVDLQRKIAGLLMRQQSVIQHLAQTLQQSASQMNQANQSLAQAKKQIASRAHGFQINGTITPHTHPIVKQLFQIPDKRIKFTESEVDIPTDADDACLLGNGKLVTEHKQDGDECADVMANISDHDRQDNHLKEWFNGGLNPCQMSWGHLLRFLPSGAARFEQMVHALLDKLEKQSGSLTQDRLQIIEQAFEHIRDARRLDDLPRIIQQLSAAQAKIVDAANVELSEINTQLGEAQKELENKVSQALELGSAPAPQPSPDVRPNEDEENELVHGQQPLTPGAPNSFR